MPLLTENTTAAECEAAYRLLIRILWVNSTYIQILLKFNLNNCARLKEVSQFLWLFKESTSDLCEELPNPYSVP